MLALRRSFVHLFLCSCMVKALASAGAVFSPIQTTTADEGKTSSPHDDARQVYLQTLAAFLENHDRPAAEQGFLKAVDLDPECAPAWFNLGVLAEAGKKWPKAREYFKYYLRVAPNGPDAGRARDQLQILSKYEDGTIDQATEKRVEYDAMIQRARAFETVKLFREAIVEASRAQALDDSRWEAYAVISLAMTRQNKVDDAAKFRELALARAPQELRSKVSEALSVPAK